MALAAVFFKGAGSGEGLPYLSEYLLCTEYGWSWHDLQAMPRPVLEYWLLYRNMQAQVQAANSTG
jgi:hypothetical protein